MKFLSPIEGARVENLASPPINPGYGRLYYNSADGHIYGYTSMGWVSLDATGDATTHNHDDRYYTKNQSDAAYIKKKPLTWNDLAGV